MHTKSAKLAYVCQHVRKLRYKKDMTTQIYIQNQPIAILSVNKEDYISLTDMAHSQMQEHIIFKWMSLKSTIEYLGEWEALYNPNFNYTEFGTIRNMAGSNNFVLSTKTWIERTNAIGIVALENVTSQKILAE